MTKKEMQEIKERFNEMQDVCKEVFESNELSKEDKKEFLNESLEFYERIKKQFSEKETID